METQTRTITKLHVLETIYQQGYENALVERTLDKIFDLERAQAQRDSNALQEQLARFETRYHLSSDKFYQQFQQGQLGDAEDYFEWSACYDMHQAVRECLHALNQEKFQKHPDQA